MPSEAYEITENHRVLLLQSLGVEDHEELPKKVEDEYWKLKRIFDRTGTIIRPADLGMMCLTLGFGKPNKEELAPPTIIDMWRKKQVKQDEKIQVKWRDKWTEAAIKGVTGQGDVIAQVIGEAEEQRFKVEDTKAVVAV